MRNGFTLIEVAIIIAISAILLSISSLTLSNLQNRTYLDTSVETLISDIKHQQVLAMSGDTAGAGTVQPFGVYFDIDSYTLFRGTVYDPEDPYNFTVSLYDNLEFLDVDFANSQLIFMSGSGEIYGLTSGEAGVTMVNTVTMDQKILEFNTYGVLTQIH